MRSEKFFLHEKGRANVETFFMLNPVKTIFRSKPFNMRKLRGLPHIMSLEWSRGRGVSEIMTLLNKLI